MRLYFRCALSHFVGDKIAVLQSFSCKKNKFNEERIDRREKFLYMEHAYGLAIVIFNQKLESNQDHQIRHEGMAFFTLSVTLMLETEHKV